MENRSHRPLFPIQTFYYEPRAAARFNPNSETVLAFMDFQGSEKEDIQCERCLEELYRTLFYRLLTEISLISYYRLKHPVFGRNRRFPAHLLGRKVHFLPLAKNMGAGWHACDVAFKLSVTF